MKIRKRKKENKLNTFISIEGYDYYLGLDWSQEGYSLARITAKSQKPKYWQGESKIEELKEQIERLKGKKILTIEETTSTHWLYVELKDYVDKIVVCDPYRNKLLSEGAKNDDIDAGKLSILLRGGFLKEVYHSMEDSYHIGKLISAYEDLIKMGVRVKNQKSALYRAMGLDHKKEKSLTKDSA
ncbi:MAG: transposase, partial [Ignavibacteria bacterium]